MESLTNAVFEHLFSRLPSSPVGWAVQVGGGVVFSLGFLTFFEHYVHRNMMHKKGLPKILYAVLPTLNRLVQRHAVMHHNTFYKQFDFEPDEAGKHENICIRFYQTCAMGSALAPIIVVLGYFSLVAMIAFMLAGYLHNKAWNIVHTEMHLPKNAWFRNTAYFRAVARHHFLHHQSQGNNLNVVLPGADFVLGTVAKATAGDVREMIRLGYVTPRTERAKKRVATMKPRPGYTFAEEASAPLALKAAA